MLTSKHQKVKIFKNPLGIKLEKSNTERAILSMYVFPCTCPTPTLVKLHGVVHLIEAFLKTTVHGVRFVLHGSLMWKAWYRMLKIEQSINSMSVNLASYPIYP